MENRGTDMRLALRVYPGAIRRRALHYIQTALHKMSDDPDKETARLIISSMNFVHFAALTAFLSSAERSRNRRDAGAIA